MQTLIEGDTGSVLGVTCKDATGAALDLTGASVTLAFKIDDGTLVEVAAQIETPSTDGKITYQFTGPQLVPGKLRSQVKVLKNSVTRTSHPLQPITVLERLA